MVHNHYLFFDSCSMGFTLMYELKLCTYVRNTTYVHAICSAEVCRKPSSAPRSAIENPNDTAHKFHCSGPPSPASGDHALQ